MRSYLDYLRQEPPPDLYPAGMRIVDGMPSLLLDTAVMTAVLVAVILLFPPFMRRVSPGFAALDAKSQHTAATYVSALLHHTLVVPTGVRHVWLEWQYGPQDVVPMYRTVVPTVCAYFVADMLASGVPDALAGNPQYLLHHALGLLLSLGAAASQPKVLRWAPHFLLCEMSSFPLAASWALRKAGMGDSAWGALANVVFALSFTVLRVVNLPLMAFWGMAQQPQPWDIPGTPGLLCFAGVVALVALQFFWWSKILVQVFGACCAVRKPREGKGKAAAAGEAGKAQ